MRRILGFFLLVGLTIFFGAGYAAVSMTDWNGDADSPRDLWDPKKYPVMLQLWHDGYETSERLKYWNRDNRAALAAYEADWKLPRTKPVNGKIVLGNELKARLYRTHPATRAQWVKVKTREKGSTELKTSECKAWIERPRAQEVTVWDGGCVDGLIDGKGTLFRIVVIEGQRSVLGFTGAMRKGKKNGHGETFTSHGYIYTGNHKDGLFNGKGVLKFVAGSETDVYTGSFKDGYPHGKGKRVSDGDVSKGIWERGCMNESKGIPVLFETVILHTMINHPIECFPGKRRSWLSSLF